VTQSSPKRPQKNKRRRGRELALQALFTLDHGERDARGPTTLLGAATGQGFAATVGNTLFRIRERALAAELECVAADGDRDEAQALAAALIGLEPKHPLALEVQAWLAGKGPSPLPPTADELVELEAVRGSLEELAFAETLVKGVWEHKEAIDRLLTDSSTNWRVARMAVVDRNILRIGVFEMQHLADIPPRVTLNEAIEIGKRYGTSESGAFINGILDKIATQLGHVKSDAKRGARAADADATPSNDAE